MIPVARVPDGSAAVAASVVHGGAAGTDVVDAAVLGGVVEVVVVRFVSPEPFELLDDEQPATSASPPTSTIGTIARARRDGTRFADIGAPAPGTVGGDPDGAGRPDRGNHRRRRYR